MADTAEGSGGEVVHTVQTRCFTGTASVSSGLCRFTVTNIDPDSWRRRSTADYTQKHCVYSTYCSTCTSIMQQRADDPRGDGGEET